MRFNKISLASLVLGGSAMLVACGGGGGDSGGGSALTVKGTAAVGAPLIGAVTATCKTGTGSATSNADGSFAVVINNGVGPCLLAITPASGAPLYSVTSGSGAVQTANITPMTNLLVGYLRSVPGMTAADPASWFALATTSALLADTTALTTRITSDFIPAVKALVPALSLTSADFLSTAFTAAAASSATDADLEKLKAAGAVTSTGAPAASTTSSLTTAASKSTPTVLPTGAGS